MIYYTYTHSQLPHTAPVLIQCLCTFNFSFKLFNKLKILWQKKNTMPQFCLFDIMLAAQSSPRSTHLNIHSRRILHRRACVFPIILWHHSPSPKVLCLHEVPQVSLFFFQHHHVPQLCSYVHFFHDLHTRFSCQ